MKLLGSAALAAMLLLAGCVTLPAVLPPEHPMSQANEYMAKLATERRVARRQASATSAKAEDRLESLLLGNAPVKPVKPDTARPKVIEGNGYRQLEQSYSGRDGESYVQLGQWIEALRYACDRQGGRFDGKFCAANGDPDRVLFMVTVERGVNRMLNDAVSYHLTLVEPTVQPTSAQYRSMLLAAGFTTQATRDARTRAAQDAAAQTAAAERARLAVDWPRMRVKGQMVCRKEESIQYVGYVEDFTDERMKVSVAQAKFGSSGNWSLGGFQPHTVWTTPEGWAPCEWSKR